MFSLGTFMGMQVGDLVITAIVLFVVAAFLLVTRNWSDDRLKDMLGGKHGRD